MWHAPIRSWATSQLRPPLWTRGRAASARPRSKMGHASAGNMRMSVKKDILLRASTRNAAKSPDKGLVVGVHARPAGLRLWARRKTWRAWACVKLQSLCARLRVGDVSTHSGVNSWPFRYRACEQPLLACLRAHLREGLNHRKQKNSLDKQKFGKSVKRPVPSFETAWNVVIVVFFRGIFSTKFWFNLTSKISAVEGVIWLIINNNSSSAHNRVHARHVDSSNLVF